jgi:hypothetical protein
LQRLGEHCRDQARAQKAPTNWCHACILCTDTILRMMIPQKRARGMRGVVLMGFCRFFRFTESCLKQYSLMIY